LPSVDDDDEGMEEVAPSSPFPFTSSVMVTGAVAFSLLLGALALIPLLWTGKNTIQELK